MKLLVSNHNMMCYLFSTSVELESENVTVCVCVCVCVSVSVPNTLGQPGDFKNGQIWLKFWTVVLCVNIWGVLFHFFKILIFGALGQVFAITRLNFRGSLETSRMVGFNWSFAHLFLGWISGGVFSFFKNFKVSLMFCYIMLHTIGP